MYIQNTELDSCLYLYKGAGDGSTPELVQQGFTHGHIRNTRNPVRDYNDAFVRKTSKKRSLCSKFFLLCKALATLYPSLQDRHINDCHVVQNHSLKTFKSYRKRSLCVFYVTAFTCSSMKLNVKKQMYAEFQPLYFYFSHKYT